MSSQTPVPKLVEGDPASSVRVLIYEDLQCPDCAAFRKMMDTELLPRFADSVAFEHRDFPLAKHSWARSAAVAACYFSTISPKVAIEFRKATLAAQSSLGDFEAYLKVFAQAHETGSAEAIAALSDKTLNAAVEASYQQGIAKGIMRTPTVLVNSDPFVETFPAAEIIKSIERELTAAKR